VPENGKTSKKNSKEDLCKDIPQNQMALKIRGNA
jgi:hypothetical protein